MSSTGDHLRWVLGHLRGRNVLPPGQILIEELIKTCPAKDVRIKVSTTGSFFDGPYRHPKFFGLLQDFNKARPVRWLLFKENAGDSVSIFNREDWFIIPDPHKTIRFSKDYRKSVRKCFN